MEDERSRRRRWVRYALVLTVCPMVGVELGNLLTRGFSWRDVVVLALIGAFLFPLVLFFTRPDRYGRDRYGRNR